MRRLKWGVLSTSRFAQQKVIPAMRHCQHAEVAAIASRDEQKARAVADQLGIPTVHRSYEDLLADPSIDVIYNPLPNHLHVPLSIRAIEAGKHVLCEKPIGLDAADARRLLEVSRLHPEIKVMEAFMYRLHPQWQLAHRLVGEGRIGEVGAIQSYFSYFNDDPTNVRNVEGIGGGGLLDIGCYCISLSRFLFNAEPRRVVGLVEVDPRFNVDRLASAILDFGGRHSVFSVSTRLTLCQRVNVIGVTGRIEIDIPFNQPPDQPARIWCHADGQTEEILLDPCNQYTVQADLFSLAVIENRPVPTPLEDAIANMRVIDAVFASSHAGSWVEV